MPDNTLQMIVGSNITESTNKENREMSGELRYVKYVFFVSNYLMFESAFLLKNPYFVLKLKGTSHQKLKTVIYSPLYCPKPVRLSFFCPEYPEDCNECDWKIRKRRFFAA